MELTIDNKGRLEKVTLSDKATIGDLKKEYAKIVKKSIYRLSFKYEKGDKTIRLDDDSKLLSSFELPENKTLVFKDLGAQIGYRTVFLLEYFGPMVFVGLYFFRPSLIFGANAAAQPYNWVASFLKT